MTAAPPDEWIKFGSTVSAYGSWLDSLGELSPHQKALAAQILTLARQVDAADHTVPLSAVATCSRELRQLATTLREVKGDPVPAPAGDPAAPPPQGTDEVAAKRKERRAAIGGAS